MIDHLTSGQVARLCSTSANSVGEYDRIGVIKAIRVGTMRDRLWTRPQTLAIGVAQVLMHYGLRGQPVYGAMREIAAHSTGDLERVLEGRPVLTLIPGVGVLAELVSRERYEQLAAATMREHQIAPIGIDVGRMWSKLHQCIADHESRGWSPAETSEEPDAADKQEVAR